MITTNSQNTILFSPPPAEIAAKAVENLPFSLHKIAASELLKICRLAEEKLSNQTEQQGCVYIKKGPETDDIKRSILLNFDEKSYSILLTKDVFFKEGTEKNITSAIKIMGRKPDEKEVIATATPLARITPKKGFVLSDREIKHEGKYGQINDLTKYENKNKEQKLTYLQIKYDHDIFEFVLDGYGDKKNYSCEVLNVLLQVGNRVKQMHKDGVVHRDIKCLNILYSHSETENDKAHLGDYGFAYAPLTEEKTGHATWYGTALYTAPERIDEMQDPKKQTLLDQAKAEDMYAIGCVMYQLLFEQDIPWTAEIEQFIENPTDTNRNRLSSRQTATKWTLESLIEKAPDGPGKDLLSCIVGLLNRNPNERVTIDQFVDTLSKIASELTSESVWIPVNKGVSREVKLLKLSNNIQKTG